MKQIIVDIDHKTGEITLQTKGFKGKECIEESDFLKKALGKIVKETKTAEYYQQEERMNQKGYFKY